MNVVRRARADLLGLQRSAFRAARLALKVVHSVRYSEDDHLAFMILAYLSKLIEQARSVRILVRKAAARDAELVARSMMEGMATLLWAAQEPTTRPFQWRGFAYVVDFRLMETRRASGETIDPEDENRIQTFLSTHSATFEDPSRAGRPDPYYRTWRQGVTIREIFDSVDGEVLYRELYGPSSDWTHSGTESMGQAIQRAGSTVRWTHNDAPTAATALATAFQSLDAATRLAIAHFDAGKFRARLDSLRSSFVGRFSP